MDYVKISRKILDWEWYTDINTKVLFLHILLKANWKDGRFQGIEIPRGSFVTSYQSLSDETGLTIRNVRTAIKHLENTEEVTVNRHAKFSVITVKNYNQYQTSDKQVTVNRQGSDSQVTTIEEEDCKRYVKAGYGYGEWVLRALLAIMEKIENREKTVKEIDKNSKARDRNRKKVSKENNKIFLLDELVEYVAKNNIYPKHSVHHSIQCPCWSVRGHYRTYKNGRTVFVKPYRKGKKRETAEPKENIYIV